MPRTMKRLAKNLDLGTLSTGHDLGEVVVGYRWTVCRGAVWETLQSNRSYEYGHTVQAPGFAPYSSDKWIEYWFPVKGTQGFVTANPEGAMNVRLKAGRVRVDISTLRNMNEKLIISQGAKRIYEKDVALKTLELFSDSVLISSQEPIVVTLGDRLIQYNTDPNDGVLSRPVETPKTLTGTASKVCTSRVRSSFVNDSTYRPKQNCNNA